MSSLLKRPYYIIGHTTYWHYTLYVDHASLAVDRVMGGGGGGDFYMHTSCTGKCFGIMMLCMSLLLVASYTAFTHGTVIRHGTAQYDYNRASARSHCDHAELRLS